MSINDAAPTGLVPPPDLMARYIEALPGELVPPLQLLFALRSAVNRVNARLVEHMGPDALSPGRMQILLMLWGSKERVAQTDVVRTLGVSRATVSELADAMIAEGLVEAASDPSHGRRRLLTLTDSGRQVAEHQLMDNARHLSVVFSRLDDTAKRDLANALDELARAN